MPEQRQPGPDRARNRGRGRRRDPARREGRSPNPNARRDRLRLGSLIGGIALIGAVAVVSGRGDPEPSTAGPEPAAQQTAKSPYGTPTKTPLPPASRIVAYTGAPQAKELGILGTMPFEQAARRLDRQVVPYARKTRPVVRAFDLIATIADAHPGASGRYRTRQSPAVIARYLRAARRHGATLILDVQPGTSNFVDETVALAGWLKQPDVQLALDPEWRMRPGVQPGSEIGHVSAGEISATLAVVAKIVRDHRLPPKLVLVHRFTDGMIQNLDQIKVPAGIVPVVSVDGVGSRALKIDTYRRIAPHLPKPWLPGFKVFYVEDSAAGGRMSGAQVMALQPRPHVVLYE